MQEEMSLEQREQEKIQKKDHTREENLINSEIYINNNCGYTTPKSESKIVWTQNVNDELIVLLYINKKFLN